MSELAVRGEWSGPTLPPDETGCYGWPRACEHADDLECHLAESMTDPVFAAAYDDAGRRFERRFPGMHRPVAVKPGKRGRHARR